MTPVMLSFEGKRICSDHVCTGPAVKKNKFTESGLDGVSRISLQPYWGKLGRAAQTAIAGAVAVPAYRNTTVKLFSQISRILLTPGVLRGREPTLYASVSMGQ